MKTIIASVLVNLSLIGVLVPLASAFDAKGFWQQQDPSLCRGPVCIDHRH
jgi:hypothetical protein